MMTKLFFKHIDNTSLVVFRMFFGLLIALESFGAIFTGWIKHTLIEPKFTFTFIGFEWLQPLPGNSMYVYYAIMGVLGVFVMLGYKYRWSMLGFTLMWSATYFMQKSSYNNHYYLLMLLSAIMTCLPANKYASLDVKYNPSIQQLSMPQWCKIVIIAQLFIMYTYASIAKLYPDWLDLTVPTMFMAGKINYPIIGGLLQNKIVHYIIAYGGILFDGLVIPLLLFKPTRRIVFCLGIFFHLFNAIVFQVGIFPFLALAFSVFFFEAETIRNIFLKQKKLYTEAEVFAPKFQHLIIAVVSVYIVVQAILPLRQHMFQDNVLWTEEGHRLSWRMMLRSKQGHATYTIVNKKTLAKTKVDLKQYLTKKQQKQASSKPDVIWQFAQHLKAEYLKKGEDVSVYVKCNISVNGRPFMALINPKVDLASVSWSAFAHSDWILPSKF